MVQAAFEVHKRLGPGMLESVYEICFCHELAKQGIQFKKQTMVPIKYDGIIFDSALRLDVIVEEIVVCELKALEILLPVHHAQVLSYLRLMNLRLGFLRNFHVPLIKQEIKRIIL
ncbi:MAG TPA: GxxExxY protein [Acidobacteriota bacterium]|nr:GxxExxY protein [Acidobacteriota bacterium]